jgi:hypothetical protein
MTASPDSSAARLAPALNAACQCIWLDRERLATQLRRELGEAGNLLESRPGLASGSVVFVDPQDAESMDTTTRLIYRALGSDAYVRHVQEHAPPLARQAADAASGVLGFDFHLGGPQPQLIEVNTNPGGLLVNLELARAVTSACDCLAEPLRGLASATVTLDDLPARIADAFRAEWTAARGDAPLRTVAIVDDVPGEQYLYPEFLLYQRLFEKAGWRTLICDAARLEARDQGLFVDGTRIDLVYNRVTDFYFSDERHAALREAYTNRLAVITPHPAEHAHWADKRLLAWLRDDALLRAAGLDAAERTHLSSAIPSTEIVSRDAADDLWRRRKELFFKPVDGYGSKAAYRGDKLTRTAFEHILSHRYVAQAIAPTSVRRVATGDEDVELRVDIRNYTHDGATLLRAARLYRGQTTNFRTPGGGFAPVLTLPAQAGDRTSSAP